MKDLFNKLLADIEKMDKDDTLVFMQKICDLLKKDVDHYDWVGFYLTSLKKENRLLLGPFAGAATEHTEIAFGEGICGQAAETMKPFIVQDVSKESNYLSCSASVVSEIVIPIMGKKCVLGEIDIDSHRLEPFTDDDRIFLESIAQMVSGKLQNGEE